MPRVVDYVARFAFLREAAFQLVRDVGLTDLTRRELARVLGIQPSSISRLLDQHASLPGLAADEVASRRRQRSWTRRDSALPPAIASLCALLPDDPAIAVELVWWRVVTDMAQGRRFTPDDVDEAAGLSLAQRFRIADRGHALGLPTPSEPAARAPDPVVARHVRERDEWVAASIDAALTHLGVTGDRRTQAALVRAVVDGLTVAVCLGRLSPADAQAALRSHLGALGDGDGGLLGAG